MSNHICETSSFQSSTLGYQIMFFFDSRAPGTQTRSNFIKMTAQFLNRKLIRGALAEIFVDSYFQAKPFVPNLYQKRNKFFDLIFALCQNPHGSKSSFTESKRNAISISNSNSEKNDGKICLLKWNVNFYRWAMSQFCNCISIHNLIGNTIEILVDLNVRTHIHDNRQRFKGSE